MEKLIICITYMTFGFQVLAQKNIVCYEYKIQYNNKSQKDSNVSLIGRKYYDSQMHLIKEVTLGPQANDSCWTTRLYDKHSNFIKEATECADSGVIGLRNCLYVYGKKGKVIREICTEYKPFFLITSTDYKKDLMAKKFYENEQNSLNGIFEKKDVDVYNPFGKTIFSFQINSKGDTVTSKKYTYFPLSDTSKVRNNLSEYVICYGKPIDDIIYLNAFSEEGIRDYYSNGKYYGSTIIAYNSQKKIVLEQYYNGIKDKVTSAIKYIYDTGGNLLQKKDEEFDEEITKVCTYSMRKIVREDYVYAKVLDHSIVYVYKTLTVPSDISHPIQTPADVKR